MGEEGLASDSSTHLTFEWQRLQRGGGDAFCLGTLHCPMLWLWFCALAQVNVFMEVF